MAKKNLRVFVSSSCLATVYMAMYAAETRQENDTDWLLVDSLELRPSQQQLIKQASTLHTFDQLFDFSSQKSEKASPLPSFTKRLTRSLKTKPIFKQVYDFLYGFKLTSEKKKLHQRVLSLTGFKKSDFATTQLHMQPVLHLNKSLFNIFPNADIHYFEHGLGDYLDISTKIKNGQKFHCVFHENFNRFLHKQNQLSDFVVPALPEKGFFSLSQQFETAFPQTKTTHLPTDKSVVLILTQSFEEYGVENEFWTHFLGLCLTKINTPENFHFIIKPHPRQSTEVLQLIEQFFNSQQLPCSIFNSPEVSSLSIEILFQSWQSQVKWVFSPFSSGVFYLAKLYPDPNIGYHYAMNILSEFSKKSPDLYKKRWAETGVFIREIFGRDLEEI